MPTFALLLEYDGSYFYGFQKQKDRKSIQESIEHAVETLIKEKIKLIAAGRTDAGVHARGMIASFSCNCEITNFSKFIISLNALTDDYVSILGMREMTNNFHARFSCSEREYEYRILISKYPRPLLFKRVYWLKNEFDQNILISQMDSLLGSHNFSSLAKKSSLINKSPERKISELRFEKLSEHPDLFRFLIRGSGFLHNMIRIMVGTLLDIAKGKIKNSSILDILNKKDRVNAGITLPAYGLYFLKAYYSKFPEIEEMYNPQNFLTIDKHG